MNFVKYNFTDIDKHYWYDEEVIAQLCHLYGSTNSFMEDFTKDCIMHMQSNVIIKMENDVFEWKMNKGNNNNLINKWFKYIPKEIYPNIIEWINDENISNIVYNNLSIKELIDEMRLPDDIKTKYYSIYFFKALKLMAQYIQNDYNDKEKYLFLASISYYTI